MGMKRVATMRIHVRAHKQQLLIGHHVRTAEPLFEGPWGLELDRLLGRNEPAQGIHTQGLAGFCKNVESGGSFEFFFLLWMPLIIAPGQAQPDLEPFGFGPVLSPAVGLFRSVNYGFIFHAVRSLWHARAAME
jgi:hypothetical protein